MKKGFTLVELLVVVLIIGVLTSIALPIYQGAVDKSHWSTMLPASKAIKDAEEAFKMTNGEYSDTMEHLDVQISNSDLQFDLQTPNNLSQPNVIRVTNSKLDGVRLASYLDDSPSFAGQLHCEALKTDERANKLCYSLSSGNRLSEINTNYIAYLLNEEIDQQLCKDSGLFWSTGTSHCYQTQAEKCSGLGAPDLGNGYCGVSISYTTLDESGTMCTGTSDYTCRENTYKDGTQCLSSGFKACSLGTFLSGSVCTGKGVSSCSSSRFLEGSVCIAENRLACGFWDGSASTFSSGSICVGNFENTCSSSSGSSLGQGTQCIANASGTCNIDYSKGGCCCGNFCPENATICSVCDSKYIQ